MTTTVPSTHTESTPAPVTTTAPEASPMRRLLSLDALRGLTIAFMIMVNNNGSDRAWWFMKHADWNGMTPTDLVFPTFLFVVGASIVFAFEARFSRGATPSQLAWQTVRRAAVLFFFGFLVNNLGSILFRSPHFQPSSWRIYGVLQRIAICYLVASLFYLWDRRWQTKAIAIVVALVGYWFLMRWVPVPGLGLPGRDIPFLDKDRNLVAWLDRQIFPGSMLYETVRDPEGLLSDLPALGTALLGMLAGMWMRSKHSLQGKAAGLAGGAATLIALGSLWALEFPLNKKLWTSSYVLVAAGISAALLSLFFWAIEVNGWNGKWTKPFLILGSNSIAAYMISELLGMFLDLIHIPYRGHTIGPLGWLFVNVIGKIPDGGLASFTYSFTYMLICFIPVWIMYRNKIFLKV
jgi:predicted acyltransferase